MGIKLAGEIDVTPRRPDKTVTLRITGLRQELFILHTEDYVKVTVSSSPIEQFFEVSVLEINTGINQADPEEILP